MLDQPFEVADFFSHEDCKSTLNTIGNGDGNAPASAGTILFGEGRAGDDASIASEQLSAKADLIETIN